jgi:hypothetical protein
VAKSSKARRWSAPDRSNTKQPDTEALTDIAGRAGVRVRFYRPEGSLPHRRRVFGAAHPVVMAP